MSEEFGLEKYLDAKFEEVHGAISGVHARLDTINGRVKRVEEEQAEQRGARSVWKWIGGGGGIAGIVALLRGFLVK